MSVCVSELVYMPFRLGIGVGVRCYWFGVGVCGWGLEVTRNYYKKTQMVG